MKKEKNPVVEAGRNEASRYTRNAPVTTGVQEKCTVSKYCTGEMRQSLVQEKSAGRYYRKNAPQVETYAICQCRRNA
jgi:hypothetical protein